MSQAQEASSILKGVIRIDDILYLVEDLAKNHPGGQLFVNMFAGRNATEAYMSIHRRGFPHTKFNGLRLLKSDDTCKEINDDYLELCERVEKVVPRTASFAPWYYFVKIGVILGVSLGIEAYMHWFVAYKWYLSAVLGLSYALIGLNIQHDANHGAISKNPMVNRLFGLTQNWIGGSSISWIHQHDVQHHIHTNDVVLDPDISGTKLLRLNPMREWQPHYTLQYIYFFWLIGLYGITAVFDFMVDVIRGKNYTVMSPFVFRQRMFDFMCSLGFLCRWVVLPLYQSPSVYTLIHIMPMMIVAGYYLAFFFILSHNFLGTEFFDKSDDDIRYTFLYRQVASSSNVGGRWLGFLNGGLNYQIEHHLFPRMNHTHYPKIAPIVRQFCDEKGIPYTHFSDIATNLKYTILHLYQMGQK
jgi:acyl-lipid (7-3)-desaturase (Delta-4 desaturase)